MVLRGWLMVLGWWQLFLLLPDVVVHPIDADSPLYRITTPQQLKVPRPGRARRLRAGMAAQGADGLRGLRGGVRLEGRQRGSD